MDVLAPCVVCGKYVEVGWGPHPPPICTACAVLAMGRTDPPEPSGEVPPVTKRGKVVDRPTGRRRRKRG